MNKYFLVTYDHIGDNFGGKLVQNTKHFAKLTLSKLSIYLAPTTTYVRNFWAKNDGLFRQAIL